MNRVITTRRVIVSTLLFFACVAFQTHRASALAEYCPARIEGVRPADVPKAPAAVFSFNLAAEGVRSVSGTAMIDTDRGWYTVDFPLTPLTLHTIAYAGPTITYTQASFSSDELFVRFQQPVTVVSAFVSAARATGDPAFGWDAKGLVACSAPAGLEAPRTASKGARDPLVARPQDSPSPRPYDPARDATLHAVPSVAPGVETCAHPFTQAVVTHAVSPQWPRGYAISQPVEVLMKVLVDADGTLADVSILQPSGFDVFDDSAKASAKASRYTAGTAFCEPAPGNYVFKAVFNPR